MLKAGDRVEERGGNDLALRSLYTNSESHERRSLVGCSPWGRSGQTRLSDFSCNFSNALEKEMATHSSILAWRIPGMGEPGGLPSMGSHRVGHN